jgi:hypothetical protein
MHGPWAFRCLYFFFFFSAEENNKHERVPMHNKPTNVGGVCMCSRFVLFPGIGVAGEGEGDRPGCSRAEE